MKYRALIDVIRSIPSLRRVAARVPTDLRDDLLGELRRRDKLKTMRRAIADPEFNLGTLEEFMLQRVEPMQAPMVLISQVHRSGGTLLSQLFDGSPAFATHPHELKISERAGEEWPRLDPVAGVQENFGRLFEGHILRALRCGYAKGDGERERHAFYMLPWVQYRLFLSLWDRFPPKHGRDILNFYFTAYFNSWLNYQGSLQRKKWFVAFAPRLADAEANVTAFFTDYPDGHLIQIVRAPRNWYPSAKFHGPGRGAARDPDEVLRPWCESAEAILRNRRRFGDRVIVLRFDDLIGRTETTMRGLCGKLEVDFDPALLRPTFNGHPIVANSSFEDMKRGVMVAPLSREKMLSEGERARIDHLCGPLYDKLITQIFKDAA